MSITASVEEQHQFHDERVRKMIFSMVAQKFVDPDQALKKSKEIFQWTKEGK